jgi:hypothetical protein
MNFDLARAWLARYCVSRFGGGFSPKGELQSLEVEMPAAWIRLERIGKNRARAYGIRRDEFDNEIFPQDVVPYQIIRDRYQLRRTSLLYWTSHRLPGTSAIIEIQLSCCGYNNCASIRVGDFRYMYWENSHARTYKFAREVVARKVGVSSLIHRILAESGPRERASFERALSIEGYRVLDEERVPQIVF